MEATHQTHVASRQIRSQTVPLQKIQTGEAVRSGDVGLNVFSPVTQNGSYEFDRVLKSGEVLKRTRKTKAWKPIYLVLRPNLLSIYKDKEETKLRHQINLSELTSVARQRDPKRKAQHVFGLFSPSRNFHLSALTDKDAQEWVELIRREAHIDEEEEEMILMSPTGGRNTYPGFERNGKRDKAESSASDQEQQRPQSSIAPENLHKARRASQTLMSYSGNDNGSYTDFSDTAGFPDSSLSLPQSKSRETTESEPTYSNCRPNMRRNASQVSGFGVNTDEERVMYHGWLYILKSKGGVRQWKKLWVVLRRKTLALYKNEEEYSANLIIPFSNIIDAVDIDAVSRSKRHCMQIISEERNYRFCAPDEEELAKWLGALKSLLAKRREKSEVQRAAAPSNIAGMPSQMLR